MRQARANIGSCEVSGIVEGAHGNFARKPKRWPEHELGHAAETREESSQFQPRRTNPSAIEKTITRQTEHGPARRPDRFASHLAELEATYALQQNSVAIRSPHQRGRAARHPQADGSASLHQRGQFFSGIEHARFYSGRWQVENVRYFID